MPINITLDGVEPWKGGAVLPKGTYLARCTEQEEGRSAGGHFEIHLTWEDTAGDGQIQDWVQVTETTLGKVRQLMEACNVQVPPGEFSLRAEMFANASAEIVVRERPKPDGTPRNEIVAYNPPAAKSDVPGAKPGEFVHAGGNAKSDDPPPF